MSATSVIFTLARSGDGLKVKQSDPTRREDQPRWTRAVTDLEKAFIKAPFIRNFERDGLIYNFSLFRFPTKGEANHFNVDCRFQLSHHDGFSFRLSKWMREYVS